MTKPFAGKITLDVRDSVPDWEPYLAPKAPEGAPNVLILAWDDLGDRYDERFRRMWRWYLLSSAGSFRARALQLWQVVLSRDGIEGGYHAARIR